MGIGTEWGDALILTESSKSESTSTNFRTGAIVAQDADLSVPLPVSKFSSYRIWVSERICTCLKDLPVHPDNLGEVGGLKDTFLELLQAAPEKSLPFARVRHGLSNVSLIVRSELGHPFQALEGVEGVLVGEPILCRYVLFAGCILFLELWRHLLGVRRRYVRNVIEG